MAEQIVIRLLRDGFLILQYPVEAPLADHIACQHVIDLILAGVRASEPGRGCRLHISYDGYIAFELHALHCGR